MTSIWYSRRWWPWCVHYMCGERTSRRRCLSSPPWGTFENSSFFFHLLFFAIVKFATTVAVLPIADIIGLAFVSARVVQVAARPDVAITTVPNTVSTLLARAAVRAVKVSAHQTAITSAAIPWAALVLALVAATVVEVAAPKADTGDTALTTPPITIVV